MVHYGCTRLPDIILNRNSTMKITNVMCAMDVAIPAMPLKPSTAAAKAITKKVRVQLSTGILLNVVHW
jgi:hypothetical protein